MERIFTSPDHCHRCDTCVYAKQARVVWDIRPCKAEEIFQEFIEYLSHGQMLDRMRNSREFLQLNRSKNK